MVSLDDMQKIYFMVKTIKLSRKVEMSRWADTRTDGIVKMGLKSAMRLKHIFSGVAKQPCLVPRPQHHDDLFHPLHLLLDAVRGEAMPWIGPFLHTFIIIAKG